MEWIKVFQIGKIPTRIVLLISITAGLLLFLPKAFLKDLILEEFIKDFGKYIGIAFIGSAGFLLLGIFGWLLEHLGSWWNNIRYGKLIVRNLLLIDGQEKAILREFFFTDSSTLPLPVQNASVAGLVNKRIIYQVGSIGGMTYGELTFNYSISPAARKKITYALIGAPNKPAMEFTEMDKQWLQENRPRFISSYRLW